VFWLHQPALMAHPQACMASLAQRAYPGIPLDRGSPGAGARNRRRKGDSPGVGDVPS
jgi:hypothetical protein